MPIKNGKHLHYDLLYDLHVESKSAMIRKLAFVSCFSQLLLKSFGNFISVIRLNPTHSEIYIIFLQKLLFLCAEVFSSEPQES